MIVLRGVSKRLASAMALHPTDLQIAAGHTAVLIGPSGSGKSTLLRLMIGLLWPDEGQVEYDGALLTSANVMALRQRIGFVVQEGGLFPHLTARANCSLMARYLGWERARLATRIDELAALVRLDPSHLDRFPRQLSGGQRQRVGLIRALMLDPNLLLLDEPLGAIDPLVRAELQEDLRTIFRTLHKTVVLVTHDLAEAAFLGDTIVLLHEGRIVQQGSLRRLLDSPSDPFVTRFVQAHRTVPQ